MKPLVLKMQSFGSYGEETIIDFSKVEQNLFLITGDTGSGKSTIFDAIIFALFGEVSSNSSKKGGYDLQSHFMTSAITPFVELSFLEKNKEYKIYRSPSHIRKKKIGEGNTTKSEEAILTLPDKSEMVRTADVNKKIQDIIGLTKEQFMQVAMIAQGEFMEMLRASSDTKKAIFRKLFKTEFYDKLILRLGEEDAKRKKEREEILITWKGELNRLFLWEEFEGKDELEEMWQKIRSSDIAIVDDMADFLEKLNLLNEVLERESEKKEKIKNELSKIRDEKRDKYNEGVHLLQSFQDVEEARGKVKALEEKEEEVQEQKNLLIQLSQAYEIYPIYQQFQNIEKDLTERKTELCMKEESFPELEKRIETAEILEEKERKEEAKARENLTALSLKTKTLLDNFKKKKEEEAALSSLKDGEKEEQKQLEGFVKELDALLREEKEGKEKVDKLAEVERQLGELKSVYEKYDLLSENLSEAQILDGEITSLQSEMPKEEKDYQNAREEYEKKSEEYKKSRTAFLDEQAGILAKEKLVEGKPCPVCGSTSHPMPCELKGNYLHLTREEIEKLHEETEVLDKKQQEIAHKLASLKTSIEEKNLSKEKLTEKLKSEIFAMMEKETGSLEEMKLALQSELEKITDEGKKVKQKKEGILKMKERLQKIEARKEELSLKKTESEKKLVGLKERISAIKATLSTIVILSEYQSEEEILKPLEEAGREKESQEKRYEEAKKILEVCREEKQKCRTLIEHLKKEIPKLEEKRKASEKGYLETLKKTSFDREEWLPIVKSHPKEEIEKIREDIQTFDNEKTEASARLLEREEKVRGKVKPDITKLKEKAENADEDLKNVSRELAEFASAYQQNLAIYTNLYGNLGRDRKKIEDFVMVHNLSERFKGKVTGGRMDLETFIQRHFLKRILFLANKRLMAMTANQYEMRIYSEEEANKGANKGLDLKVYSYVTGQEREIRTLSGGESFMAALALALGISDQIHEKTSAIELDIMFVDEGFGSLDDHARNQAVKVLKEMAGGKRLIGIISHVNELKQEMEEQLLVTKDQNGSKAVWRV